MQYRKLSDLKKLENNPRVIRDKQFKTLCQSIKDNPKYFEARPLILSDRQGFLEIIAGNQRYEAARFLKLVEVPTYLMEGLTEEKEREIIIRDNVSNGEFNFSELANSWDDLLLTEWGVDLPVMNYEDIEFQDVDFKNNDNEKKRIIITCMVKDLDAVKQAIATLSLKFPGMSYYV